MCPCAPAPRPFFARSFADCTSDVWKAAHPTVLQAVREAVPPKWQLAHGVALPAAMHSVSGSNTTQLRCAGAHTRYHTLCQERRAPSTHHHLVVCG
jgi:hypothetical protein